MLPRQPALKNYLPRMHTPVLTKEVIHYLNPGPNRNFVDATLGEAGHASLILLKNGPGGKVLGIDADTDEINRLKEKLSESRLIVANGSYADLKSIIAKKGFKDVYGILADLGMSSWQIDEAGRGFAFSKDEPLDMRLLRKKL